MILLKSQQLDKLTRASLLGSRELSPQLARHFHLLSDRDRQIVNLSYRHGLSHRQLGSLLNLSPGTVTRRLRRVLHLLRDPLVVALLSPDCPLGPEHRAIAIERYLHGRTIPEIARRRRIARRQVRRMLEYVRGWHSARGSSPVSIQD